MSALLLDLEERWVRLEGDTALELSAWPELRESALVVSDFGAGMLSGVIALEGNPVHAPALINRRLMNEGAIDGESRVRIHAVEKAGAGRGYQVSYSAIPAARWQRRAGWSGAQPRVCLNLALMTLLWKNVGPAHALVARSGRSLMFIARLERQLFHCAALAFSEERSDLEDAVRSLAERAGLELAAQGAVAPRLALMWHTAYARASGPAHGEDQSLARLFFGLSGLQGEIAPTRVCRLVALPGALEGTRDEWLETSLPGLLNGLSFMGSVEPLARRVSWALERWAPAWSALCGALAVAGGLYAGALFVSARSLTDQAASIGAQAHDLQVQAQTLAPRTQMPAGYEAWAREVAAQEALTHRFDVNHIVGTVGEAARVAGVRVLRIYSASVGPTEQAERGAGAARVRPAAGRALVVDGALGDGADSNATQRLARFVAQLRAGGFEATPVDTSAGKVDGNLLARVFTYRLTPAREPMP